MNSIQPFLKTGQLISLESTTYPGTSEEELLPKITDAGFVVGDNFFLVYSPEREDPGNSYFNTSNIPKVVGGATDECLEIGCKLYGNAISEVVPVSSLKVAEFTKLLENIHRAVNIGLVNELKVIADKMGIDIMESIQAAASKPFDLLLISGPGMGDIASHLILSI